MKIGIAGFQGTGKSTVFRLLTGATPDPHALLKGQLGVAQVPDPRLDFLRHLFQPKKCTPASIDLVDLPAVVGEDRAENARRLAILREADGILCVLGAFTGADPVQELRRFHEELYLADLEVTTNRIDRVKAGVHKARPDLKALEHEAAVLDRILQALEAGRPAGSVHLAPDDARLVAGFRYLTDKPLMPLVNVDEAHQHAPLPEALGPWAQSLCARLELELQELAEADRRAFMDEMGLRELGRDRIVRTAYAAMGRITFFTYAHDDLRAWSLPQGADAVTAAGKVHTDMARGFIRAEVIGADQLQQAGDLKQARAHGLVRTEGRDYVVRDGDVILFRFNV